MPKQESICPTTGLHCEALRLFNSFDTEVVTNGKKELAETLEKSHEQECLEIAYRLCSGEECGIIDLGSVLGLKIYAIESTRVDLTP